jgi:hypothetical protein
MVGYAALARVERSSHNSDGIRRAAGVGEGHGVGSGSEAFR